ncbi:MAG: glucose 1-dehydrogenase [Alphaproteobacteria bacterium]|nr:MAG: glucose 1-dehydrogenase [Alphaproteobacteria bacterium]
MSRVAGKIALVTGGAAGIGEACARVLAREGATVIITDVQDARGEKLASDIYASGGKAAYKHQDVVTEAGWQQLIGEIEDEYGGLDVLVNNAGIGNGGAITEMSYESYSQMMAINVDGVFLGCKHAIPLMTKSGGGSIINISSVAGLKGAPGLSAYSASKGAVRLLSRSLAIECARAGIKIRVNSVHPGIIDTEIWTKISASTADNLTPLGGANTLSAKMVAEMAAVPIGHAAEPVEIANGVLFLASDESRYVTGSELVIDGGMCA